MIRFAVISDVQYGDLDDSNGRSYRESLSKYLSAVGDIVSEKVPFVLQLGDASQSGWENHLAIRELFNVGKNAGIKWRHVLGNHDFLVDDDKKAQVYTNFGIAKPGYYDFKIKDPTDNSNVWRFIVLNGNEISEYAAENNNQRELAQQERERWRLSDNSLPKTWNGSVSKTQLLWLDERLQFATSQNENVIICSHFPLFANSKSLNSKRTRLASLVALNIYYYKLGQTTWNGQEILDVLDKYPCVKAYFAGHLHEGSYGERNKVAHVTFKGIVENSPNAYAFVKLTKTSVVVEGRKAQPSYSFKFQR